MLLFGEIPCIAFSRRFVCPTRRCNAWQSGNGCAASPVEIALSEMFRNAELPRRGSGILNLRDHLNFVMCHGGRQRVRLASGRHNAVRQNTL